MKSTGLTQSHSAQLTGSCLCGGVRYRLDGQARDVVNCFCGQCQKTSGHYVAATRVAKTDLTIEQGDTLRWYDSSKEAKRGFCRQCGGNLFWDNNTEDSISIMAGTLDKPTGLQTTLNINTEDASDYQLIPEIKSLD